MPSPLVNATLQAAGLSALSNFLAQIIRSYRTDKPFILDLPPLLQFVIFTLISCPPNFLWQQYLEHKLPGRVSAFPSSDKDTEKKVVFDEHKTFSVKNTATKFLLDQTVGAAVNTIFFIGGIGVLKGKDLSTIITDCQTDFWPIVTSGLKLWPLVSLFNFTLVPVDRRVIVGSLVGVGWGIYLSLLVG